MHSQDSLSGLVAWCCCDRVCALCFASKVGAGQDRLGMLSSRVAEPPRLCAEMVEFGIVSRDQT